MTQPAAPLAPALPIQTAPTAAAPAAVSAKSSVADRAAALKEKLEASPEPADEGESSAPPAPPSSADSGNAPQDEASQRRAERMARINKGVAELRQREAAKNSERQQRQKYQVNQGEVEKLTKRLADLEPMEQAWKDPMSVLEWAEKKGVPAPDLVKALREKASDPEAVAARQARTVEEKLRAEIQDVHRKLAEVEERRQAEAMQAREQSEGTQKAVQFHARVAEKAGEYPLTAGFAKAHGGGVMVAVANKWLAPHLPEDYSIEQLHDHFEQLLEAFQVTGQQASTATAGAPQQNTGAAQPAITLNNRTTAGRETVTEEIPLHRLPKSERVRRAREKYERE